MTEVRRYGIEEMRQLANANPGGSWLDPHLLEIERDAFDLAMADERNIRPDVRERLYRHRIREVLMDLLSGPGSDYRLNRLRLSAANPREAP